MIQARSISKIFMHRGTHIAALKDVSFTLPTGKSLAIYGRSGAGKSTLLNILGGLDRPASGHVLINDMNITQMKESAEARFRNQHLGFIFQFHHLLHDFNIPENVMMPLLIKKTNRREAKSTALSVLEQVGILDKKTRYPQELSGGEQQRAAIARAIAHKPGLILADEPTGNLDDNNGMLVFELLCRLNRDLGATLIVVTHNHHFAGMLNHRLTLEAGQVSLFE